MGVRNYLIEGVSGTGKSSVREELQRRGYHAVDGHRELAYQGDPETGIPTEGRTHEHHIWNVERVQALISDRSEKVTFFCGVTELPEVHPPVRRRVRPRRRP